MLKYVANLQEHIVYFDNFLTNWDVLLRIQSNQYWEKISWQIDFYSFQDIAKGDTKNLWLPISHKWSTPLCQAKCQQKCYNWSVQIQKLGNPYLGTLYRFFQIHEFFWEVLAKALSVNFFSAPFRTQRVEKTDIGSYVWITVLIPCALSVLFIRWASPWKWTIKKILLTLSVICKSASNYNFYLKKRNVLSWDKLFLS
jgi:hypothetical protein